MSLNRPIRSHKPGNPVRVSNDKLFVVDGKDNIRPLKGHLFIKVDPQYEEKLDSGIIIPETVENESYFLTGKVVYPDPNYSDIIAGDVILFDKYYTQPVMINGEQLIVVRRLDVVGVVEVN